MLSTVCADLRRLSAQSELCADFAQTLSAECADALSNVCAPSWPSAEESEERVWESVSVVPCNMSHYD